MSHLGRRPYRSGLFDLLTGALRNRRSPKLVECFGLDANGAMARRTDAHRSRERLRIAVEMIDQLIQPFSVKRCHHSSIRRYALSTVPYSLARDVSLAVLCG